mgnify:CR=1 FL=1
MSQVATALLALVAQQRQLLRSTWYGLVLHELGPPARVRHVAVDVHRGATVWIDRVLPRRRRGSMITAIQVHVQARCEMMRRDQRQLRGRRTDHGGGSQDERVEDHGGELHGGSRTMRDR